jgi:hypothetical protein
MGTKSGGVGHEIYLPEPEPVAEFRDDFGQRGYRQILARGRAAVRGEVDGDAPAGARQLLDDMPPQQAVRGESVHEPGGRGRPVAKLGVGDLAAGRGRVQRPDGAGTNECYDRAVAREHHQTGRPGASHA